MRVLIVEDDAETRALLERGLKEELFRVDAVSEGLAAETTAQSGAFDAIILDVVLPGHDGFAVCRRLRTRGIDTPILMLTGRYCLDDRVKGLDAGADDYLAKPFAFAELTARLRALTRRGRTRTMHSVLACGPIEFDQRHHGVRVAGASIVLSATELRLLEYLLVRCDTLVSRNELMAHVWGDTVPSDSKVVEVYISYLRKKLGVAGSLVRTIRGAGYTLTTGPH